MTMASSGKILVVDDDDDSRTLLSHLLKREGYEVITAIDGQDAVEKLPDDSIDVLLLDVMMPRMDGFAVCEALKKDPKTKDKEVKIVWQITGQKTRAVAVEGENVFVQEITDMTGKFAAGFSHLSV